MVLAHRLTYVRVYSVIDRGENPDLYTHQRLEQSKQAQVNTDNRLRALDVCWCCVAASALSSNLTHTHTHTLSLSLSLSHWCNGIDVNVRHEAFPNQT
jgi:hypothetical protein